MPRATLALLGVGVGLLVLSLLLFVFLPQWLVVCPNPGVCTSHLDWTTLIPGIVVSSLGVVAILTAWVLSWSRRR